MFLVFLSIAFSTVRFLLLWSSRFEFETISCTLRCTPSVPGSAPGFPRLPSPAKAPPEAPELVRGLPRTISESWMFSIYKDHTEVSYMCYVSVFAILNWY